MTRPANVPEGAHVQWEIELIGFEMSKVFFHPCKIVIFSVDFIEALSSREDLKRLS